MDKINIYTEKKWNGKKHNQSNVHRALKIDRKVNLFQNKTDEMNDDTWFVFGKNLNVRDVLRNI